MRKHAFRLNLSLLAMFFLFSPWSVTCAQQGGAHPACQLRLKIEKTPVPASRGGVSSCEKFLLPVSQGFDQKGSDLCWVYATLSALETLNRIHYPNLSIDLSRRFLQRITLQDRLERYLTNPSEELNDRGTAMDAILLIAQNGMAQFHDIPDISDTYVPDMDAILKGVESLPTVREKKNKIAAELDAIYGLLPDTTKIENRTLTLKDFGRFLLGRSSWQSYAPITAEHPAGLGKDPDPDTRGIDQVLFVPMNEIKGKIHDALKNKIPVIYSNIQHLILIYGAEYDQNGNATLFYVKDSYPPYYYQAEPDRIYSNLGEITTLQFGKE